MTQYTAVERTTVIAAAPGEILPHLTDFHRWRAWSPWEDRDPELRRTYSGPRSGVGARYEWSGNRKAGAGQMTIESVDASVVRVDLVFTKPFASSSKAVFVLRPDQGDPRATAVSWQVLSPKTKLMRVMGLIMNLEKTIGPDLERGLAQLKQRVEG